MSDTSLASQGSIGSLGDADDDAFSDSGNENLAPFMFVSNGKNDSPHGAQLAQYQVAAVAVKCTHLSMLVSCLHSASKATGIWLPYIAVKESYKFHHGMQTLLAEFLLRELNLPYERQKLQGKVPYPFEKISLHTVTRIQLPNGEFVTRAIYLASWSAEATCCQNTANFKWIPASVASKPATAGSEHRDIVNRFWGIEVSVFAGHLTVCDLSTASKKIDKIEECTAADAFKYVKRSSLDENAESPSSTTTMFAEFVASSKYTEKDVAKLYSDFVQQCYPSVTMSFPSYKDYCEKIALGLFLDEAKQRKSFQASNYKKKNFLTFNEFLLGMVSLDPDSPHTRPRYAFVFRYYDSDNDGTLSQEDMKRLLTDSRRFIEWRMNTATLDLTQFAEEIQSDRLKGTTNLCRSTRSILRLMKMANAYALIPYKNTLLGSEVEANCCKCRPKNYTLAMHSGELTSSGTLVEPTPIIRQWSDACESTQMRVLRQHSAEYIFKSTSYANYVLDIVRKLRDVNRMTEDKKRQVRTEVTNGLTLNVITGICEEMIEVLQAESRVLQVSTPSFVMGDIHGNINDLLTFETQLWPMAPMGMTANVLFLGDYVDRGEFCVEVVCYLFAMKLLAPTKFFLLRGNHEVRQIQRAFTFEKECIEKYNNHGISVFEIFNRVFDLLPFAGVIDESIFCAHGGIPFSILTIEGLNQLPAAVGEPEQEAPAIWEILWSDPITTPEFKQLADFMSKKDDTGYLSNMKRSTAFYFSEIATSNFLKKNNLSRVIRAHEVVNEGYRFNHNGSVITIFSCSRYCGGPNKAAAILIEGYGSNGLIKIISLDT